MKKVLFLDKVHPLIMEQLSSYGYQCEEHFTETGEAIAEIVHDYSGIIVRSRINLDRKILSEAKALKFIGRVGSGMENIDVAYAESLGIHCLNSPEGNRDAVGEHALGMLLSLMNNMSRADKQVRQGKWLREANRGTEIKGKTVGIIGYGNMGSAFAQRLKGFEAEVISFDKYKTVYSDGNTREVSLEEIFRSADILSIHVPLTEETQHMVDQGFLRKFRKSIWLINTSRGPVVNTKDLADALRSGKVIGAALDVLEVEDRSFETLAGKLPGEIKYLMELDNVLFTPHIAGWTHESNIKLAQVLVEKILR